MRTPTALTMIVALMALPSCSLGPSVPADACEERITAWPDHDDDGLGENTGIYVGCSPPEGWVTNNDDTAPGPPPDTGDDTEVPDDTGEVDSGSTDSAGDTAGDTAAPDTATDTGSGMDSDTAGDSGGVDSDDTDTDSGNEDSDSGT